MASAVAAQIVGLPECMIFKLPLMTIFSSFTNRIRIEDKDAIPLTLRSACVSLFQSGLESVQIAATDANSLVETLAQSPAASKLKSLQVVSNQPADHWRGISPGCVSSFRSLESCSLMNGAADLNTIREFLRLPNLRSVEFSPYASGLELKSVVAAIVELSTQLESIILRLPNNEDDFFDFAIDKFAEWTGRHFVKHLSFLTDFGSVKKGELQRLGIPEIFPNLESSTEDILHPKKVSSIEEIQRDDNLEHFHALILRNLMVTQEVLDNMFERMPSLTGMNLSTEGSLANLKSFGVDRFSRLKTIVLSCNASSFCIIESWPQKLEYLSFQIKGAVETKRSPTTSDFFRSLWPIKTLKTLQLDFRDDDFDTSDLYLLLVKLSRLNHFSLSVHSNNAPQGKREIIISHPTLTFVGVHVRGVEMIYGRLGSLTSLIYAPGKLRAGVSYLPELRSISCIDPEMPFDVLLHAKNLCELKISRELAPRFLQGVATGLSSIRQLSISFSEINETELKMLLKGMPRLWSLDLSGWHDGPQQLPKRVSTFNWLKHPTLSKISIRGAPDPRHCLGSITLSGTDLPLLCQLTLCFPQIQVSEIKLERFDLLDNVSLDCSSDDGVELTIMDCVAVKALELRGSAKPSKRLRKIVIDNAPELEVIRTENHNYPSLSLTQINAPKLNFANISSYSKNDSTTLATLQSLVKRWQDANSNGKFLLSPSFW